MGEKPLVRDGSDEVLARRRRGRNVAMLVLLLALCALFYAISIVKLAGEATGRGGGGDAGVVSGGLVWARS